MSSLCLKVRGPASPSPVSIVVAPSLTWGEFIELLRTELKLTEEFEVMCGYPASIASFQGDQVVGEVLKTNEAIRVQLKASTGQQAQGEGKIKAKKKPAASTASASLPGFGARIAGLKASSVPRAAAANSPTKRPLASSSSSQAPALKRRRKSSATNAISSEGDIAEHLVSAVSGGKGLQNRIARKVFRNAVLHQYNSSQAVSRVNATFSGAYTIRECGGVLLASSSSGAKPVYTHIEVTYNKGAGSRGAHVDTVELLSRDLLLGVLKVAVLNDAGGTEGTEEGREALKPMNLSRCSPRIFWSIVYHYGPNLVENIKSILAGVDDCAWLDERKRELSEKARINAQQKEEQMRGKKKGKKGEVAAVVEVDGAARQSDAGTAGGPPPTPSKAAVATASETPLQRWLAQLVDARMPLAAFVPADWLGAVQGFLRSTGKEPTATALAALEASSKLRAAITDAASTTAQGSSSSSSARSSSGGAPRLSLDQLESWIVGAQVETFHVIWRLICGGGAERLRSALHEFRVRRPRDFRMWRNAPEGLLQGLLDCDTALTGVGYVWEEGALELSDLVAVKSADLDAARVAWMGQIALGAAAVFPWMDSEGLAEQSSGDGADADEDDGGDAEGGAGEEAEEEMAWQYDASASAYMGRRVRVEVDNGYWEDGAVVAYLPPEPDEPMALWKVRLDGRSPSAVAGAGVGKKGKDAEQRYEDLEEHELLEAIDRLARCVKGNK